MAIHEKNCPNFEEKKIQLSCDGVHETKSSSTSIDVYSVNMRQCKIIYPHKLIRPLRKEFADSKRHLREVVDDITDNDMRITQYVGDQPKRSDAKGCKGHSSWFPCEYCYSKGLKIFINENSKAQKKILDQIKLIEDKKNQCENENTPESRANAANLSSLKEELKKSLNALKRKSNILWPSSTKNGVFRSRRSILEIVEKLENGEVLSIDEAKGIVSRSVLLDIPEFNFVYDVPAEYMHLACLGVIKRMVELTFNVGENRSRTTNRRLSLSSDFDKLISIVKVTKEFPRRARKLDFAVYKALEFRNLALFFFPLILECIEEGEKERDLWLYLVFTLRSSVVPSEEYAPLNIPFIEECCAKFYDLFEALFGMKNCTYNLHVFCCHLTGIRTHGPLTETSAFKFESFYGELRRSFVPGTISPLKQVMKNVFLKRALSKHQCTKNLFLSNYDTPLECNRLVYTYSNKKYLMYEIRDITGDTLTCHKIGQYPVTFQEIPEIDWSSVGVFRKGGICSNSTKLKTSEISGKVINVKNYLITCPTNVLNEK